MKEIWRAVVGYEGLYEVSNFGRVKRLTGKRCRQERILKTKKDEGGYLLVHLSKEGKGKTLRVHRLVAQAFIPNPQNLPCINHKNKQRDFNFVENLEWCTYEYNNNYEDHNEKISKAKINGKKSKPVYQKTLDGKLVREWPSTKEVQRQTGWNQANISACCLGKRPTAYGFRWSYSKL